MKKKLINWFLIAILIGIIALSMYNIKNNANFFDITIYHVLSLFFVLVFAFYFTQRMNDERKLKDSAERIICMIQEHINSKSLYAFEEDFNRSEFLMRKRYIENKIDALKKITIRLNLSEDALYIRNQFDKYADLVDENSCTKGKLSTMSVGLQKQLLLIDNKCDELKISLFL